MENDEILAKLEKYAPWLITHRRFAGPILITNIIYILVYLSITFYLWNDVFKLNNLLQNLYLIGFGIFIIAIYLAYFGFLLRSINKENTKSEAK